MNALPRWPQGTVGVLCASGPHPIPVSTAVRAGDDRFLFALGGRREALGRLREDPQAAFCLMAEGLAFTAHGRVSVLRERLEAGPAALEFAVEHVQDHLADGRTEMVGAPEWRWAEEEAAEADRRVRAELAALVGEGGDAGSGNAGRG